MSIFMSLYLVAYWLISRLKRKTEREVLYAGEEDYFVYRVSVWMCSISMGISIGSLTLLPFSVIGVELLQLYENNYYLQWLSYSLIGSLWNYVFTLSNLSLFVLLPFSYFFIESQGFSNASARDGITQRVYETLAICALFIVVLLCLAEIVLTIIKYPVSFLSITSVNLPLIYSCVSLGGALLLLISTPYGFAKMFSFVRDFFFEEPEPKTEVENEVETEQSDATIVNEDNRKDSDSGIESGSTDEMRFDSEEDLFGVASSGDATLSKLRRRKRKHDYSQGGSNERRVIQPTVDPIRNHHDYSNLSNYHVTRQRCYSESDDFSRVDLSTTNLGFYERQKKYSDLFSKNQAGDFSLSHYYAGTPRKFSHSSNVYLPVNYSSPIISEMVVGSPMFTSTPLGLAFNIENIDGNSRVPERRTKSEEALWKPSQVLANVGRSSVFRRAVGKVRSAIRLSKHGKIVKLLLGLRFPTIVAILLVMTAIALMMVAINTLKLMFGYRSLPEYAQYIEVHTRHSFGLFGACIETLIIIYVMLTSFVGLYSLPLLRSIRPVKNDTSMTAVIINSSLVLVASSALPVIVNTLGMTTFDLLGSYSSLQWLSSFRVVLAYNMMFLIISLAFLFNQLTSPMRREILKRLYQLRCRSWRRRKPKTDILISTSEKQE